MKQHTITDQPRILRLLVEQGLDGRIKPLRPDRPGACAMAGDINKLDTFYIIDLLDGVYTVTILEECPAEEAVACLREYTRRVLITPVDVRLEIISNPAPVNN